MIWSTEHETLEETKSCRFLKFNCQGLVLNLDAICFAIATVRVTEDEMSEKTELLRQWQKTRKISVPLKLLPSERATSSAWFAVLQTYGAALLYTSSAWRSCVGPFCYSLSWVVHIQRKKSSEEQLCFLTLTCPFCISGTCAYCNQVNYRFLSTWYMSQNGFDAE